MRIFAKFFDKNFKINIFLYFILSISSFCKSLQIGFLYEQNFIIGDISNEYYILKIKLYYYHVIDLDINYILKMLYKKNFFY